MRKSPHRLGWETWYFVKTAPCWNYHIIVQIGFQCTTSWYSYVRVGNPMIFIHEDICCFDYLNPILDGVLTGSLKVEGGNFYPPLEKSYFHNDSRNILCYTNKVLQMMRTQWKKSEVASLWRHIIAYYLITMAKFRPTDPKFQVPEISANSWGKPLRCECYSWKHVKFYKTLKF